MDNDCPEISVIHDCLPGCRCNNTNSYSIAPGEGKIPSNMMRDNDWDINAFLIYIQPEDLDQIFLEKLN